MRLDARCVSSMRSPSPAKSTVWSPTMSPPRTVRPDGEPALYDLAVRVYAIGLDPITVSESVSFLNLIKDHS